jgi:hypothetical protein
MYQGLAWLITVGSRFDGWIYWHFFTITINYNRSQSLTVCYSLHSSLDHERLLFLCDEWWKTNQCSPLHLLEERFSQEWILKSLHSSVHRLFRIHGNSFAMNPLSRKHACWNIRYWTTGILLLPALSRDMLNRLSPNGWSYPIAMYMLKSKSFSCSSNVWNWMRFLHTIY